MGMPSGVGMNISSLDPWGARLLCRARTVLRGARAPGELVLLLLEGPFVLGDSA